MASFHERKITSVHPATGATAGEQIAKKAMAQNGGEDKFGMQDNDKLIYELVQKNVVFAKEQFGDNLHFNSKTLTEVLYQNIYKLIGDKVVEDDFVKWAAEALISNGAVTKTSDSSTSSTPTTEVVTELDTSAYDELCQQIANVVDILKTNKLYILELFSNVENTIKEIDANEDARQSKEQSISTTQLQKSEQDIKSRNDKLKQNQDAVIAFIEQHDKQKSLIDASIKSIKDKMNGIVSRLSGMASEEQSQTDQQTQGTKIGSSLIVGTNNLNSDQNAESKDTDTKLDTKTSVLEKVKKSSGKKAKQLKLSISKKIDSLKFKIANSPLGKVFAGIGKVLSAVKNVVKKVLAVAKTVAKAFVAASYVVGKGVVKGAQAIWRGVKNFAHNMSSTLGRKKIKQAIMNFAPGQLVVKLGFKAIKWVGKMIWAGLKKLAFKIAGVFVNLFSVGKKFKNTMAFYATRLAVGIKDTTYKFLVKPIASILVSVFAFMMAMLTSPIQFMKWLSTSMMERIREMLHDIKGMVKKVLGLALGMIGKILFNPITLILIVGALFYFFWPQIKKLFAGGISGFVNLWKNTIVPFLKSAAGMIVQIANSVVAIAKWIWYVVDWVTNPNSWLAKLIYGGAKAFLWVKGLIKKLLVTTGRDSVDLLCKFLAGDYISIALDLAVTGIKWLWNWMKNKKFIRKLLNIIDAVVSYYTMGFKIIARAYDIGLAEWVKHPQESLKQTLKPVSEFIDKLKKIFNDQDVDAALTVDPIELSEEQSANTYAAINNLKMRGMNGEKVLAKMDSLQQLQGYSADKGVLKRIEQMSEFVQTNVSQVNNYDKFIKSVWDEAHGNQDLMNKYLKEMLESPIISQRLLSAFFYINPQDGSMLQTMPSAYIEQFLSNIRKMMNDDGISIDEKFQTIIEAFDQANKERSSVINEQNKTLEKFCTDIKKFDLNRKNADNILAQMIGRMNTGLFKNVSVQQSFNNIKAGYAKTQNLKSATGRNLGTNKLFSFTDAKDKNGRVVPVSDDMFKMKTPKNDDNEVVDKIILPPKLAGKPESDQLVLDSGETVDLKKKWIEHLKKRQELLSKHSGKELDEMGYRNYTLDEFKQQYMKNNLSPERLKQIEIERRRRAEGIRLGKKIQAYNSQGVEAKEQGGFSIGKGAKASLLNITADGLSNVMLMYSPEWMQVQKMMIDELQVYRMMNMQDSQEAQRIRQAQEEELQKKKADEAEKKRQQEILDYSAKVEGGFIEVKMGEDETAMREALNVHMHKRNELLSKYSGKELDAMGFKLYSWEEWKRYYRKMHGLPEDGIKRIPFEGKRKERKINWGARYALSTEELQKYGITMSEDGPVMIPMDKAMEVAGSLLAQAKTIYSVRDGLEVISQGLKGETDKLKKRNQGGMPMAVVNNAPAKSPTTSVTPPVQPQSPLQQ